jgi:hypothetical protein
LKIGYRDNVFHIRHKLIFYTNYVFNSISEYVPIVKNKLV